MTYLSSIFSKVLKPTFLAGDVAGFLIAPIVQVWTGRAMSGPDLSWLIVYIAGTAAFVRLISAPYLVWRDQNERINSLEYDLKKPERTERDCLAKNYAELKSNMSGALSEIAYLAENHVRSSNGGGGAFHTTAYNARVLLHQFSDDPDLMQDIRDYIQFCAIVIDQKDEREDYRKTMKEFLEIGRRIYPKLRH